MYNNLNLHILIFMVKKVHKELQQLNRLHIFYLKLIKIKVEELIYQNLVLQYMIGKSFSLKNI